MSNDIIAVESLAKRYRIGQREETYQTFRETLVGAITAPIKSFRRLRNLTTFDESRSGIESGERPVEDDTIWALRDVTFSVRPGEVLGIIGRNGAGKTTLLKVLSRITEPSFGSVRLYGRVSSLLEVGTGFHPELTGRENIYLNGAILGMRKVEIDAKFDEIVAFAEIEKFLDTPVKRYSSGMYVRLAFSVAAHLEPEILLVDEVLAVGDAKFQRKCLKKMEGVAGGGRTVIFVSHQMGQVASLCTRCLLIEDGRVALDDEPAKVIEGYHSALAGVQTTALKNRRDRTGSGRVGFVDAWLEDEKGQRATHFLSGTWVKFVMEYEVPSGEPVSNVVFNFSLFNHYGLWVTNLNVDAVRGTVDITEAHGRLECVVRRLPINAGQFNCNVMVRSGNSGEEIFDFIQDAMTFSVEPGDYFGTGALMGNKFVMVMDQEWRQFQHPAAPSSRRADDAQSAK